ncbi:MAG: PA0069 family radical SAM protein [Gemmatimonadota bacterium]|jgi:DNA repair photolyase|nr:PA0069 family radical SAM protein [Gemmatimonadota bacterium]
MTDLKKLPMLPALHGRGTSNNPASRFVPLEFEPDLDLLDDPAEEQPAPQTLFLRDTTRTVINWNDSPDVGFDFSLNPYRGCEHGCIYCYARPTHEYFGLSAGLDFETRIFVKEDAPELLQRELSSPNWQPKPIAFSGVTDPYQPVERRLLLTRRCLRVLADFGNPVSVISKNHLISRDADILGEMAGESAAMAALSVTTLDPALQRLMEPRTSTPARRLAAIEKLATAGVPVAVMIAPVIPGLTDHEIPAILKAAADAGATAAGFIPVRLPFGVAPLFERWLRTHFPDRTEKVLGRIRGIRGGRLNDPRFGARMRGEGKYVEQLGALFRAARERFGLNGEHHELSTRAWRGPGRQPPPDPSQLDLF